MSKFIKQRLLDVKKIGFSLKKAGSHHDKFFKRFFSEPRLALDIIRLIFSKTQLAKYDLSKLKVEKGFFKGLNMDLILSLPLKGLPFKHIKIIILLEHKSRYDKSLFKQFLKYQAWLYEHSNQTIAVIPVLFYHGKKDWKWPLSFQKSIFGEEFFSKIPIFIRKSMIEYQIKLFNTKSRRVQRVFKDASFKAGRVFQLMDRIWQIEENEEELKEILFAFFKDFPQDDKILALVKYLTAMGMKRKLWEQLEKEAIKKGLLKKGGYMDITREIKEEGLLEGWQKGQQEGWQKGRLEGRLEGQQELILNMLKEKTAISYIVKVTGLTAKEIKKLKNGS